MTSAKHCFVVFSRSGDLDVACFTTVLTVSVSVIVMSSMPTTLYECGTRRDWHPPRLRAVRTTGARNLDRVPSLEAPNVLEGLPASILSHVRCVFYRFFLTYR